MMLERGSRYGWNQRDEGGVSGFSGASEVCMGGRMKEVVLHHQGRGKGQGKRVGWLRGLYPVFTFEGISFVTLYKSHVYKDKNDANYDQH